MNKDEIKAFLEALGYIVLDDSVVTKSGFPLLISSGFNSNAEYALEWYLNIELGKHWHSVWYSTAIRNVLGIEIVKKIETAIAYYEALQDEA